MAVGSNGELGACRQGESKSDLGEKGHRDMDSRAVGWRSSLLTLEQYRIPVQECSREDLRLDTGRVHLLLFTGFGKYLPTTAYWWFLWLLV